MRRHWSHSSVTLFEQCPRRYKLRYRDGLPDPPGPALVRGNLVHSQLEAALRAPVSPKKKAKDWVGKIVDRYRALDRMRPEVALHLDKKWKPVPERDGYYVPPGTYVTGKIDVLAPGFISDWKSGKIYTDKHEDQLHLYATMLASVTGILRWECELVYVDQEHVDHFTIRFDDPEGETLRDAQRSWEARANKVYTEKRFPKEPSRLCGWCPYHKDKGGPCDGKRES